MRLDTPYNLISSFIAAARIASPAMYTIPRTHMVAAGPNDFMVDWILDPDVIAPRRKIARLH